MMSSTLSRCLTSSRMLSYCHHAATKRIISSITPSSSHVTFVPRCLTSVNSLEHLLDTNQHFATLLFRSPTPIAYKLPTVWYNDEVKKTIVDPTLFYRVYELPMGGKSITKDAPTSRGVSNPIVDPNNGPEIFKATLPYLMTIRHKKMKRHKLKKLRKRMRFLMRRRRAVKLRKKEQAMKELERKIAKEAIDYDPEKHIEEKMELARRSGWGIDVVAEYMKKQPNASDQHKTSTAKQE